MDLTSVPIEKFWVTAAIFVAMFIILWRGFKLGFFVSTIIALAGSIMLLVTNVVYKINLDVGSWFR